MDDASSKASQATAPRPVRQAASLIVLRDGAQGLETLLLRRVDKANDQNSGATVFPGGLVDAHDRQLHDCCTGIDDLAASARLSMAQGGLDYYAAAVRECFEEAGLLFAQDARGRLVDLGQLGTGELAAMRAAAAAGTEALLALCRARGWQLAMDRLAYFAHWLTPPGMPRRFDTRFFVATLPPGQEVQVDSVEIARHDWLRPQEAIDPARRLKLMNVQHRILQSLAGFASVEECMARTRALQSIVLNMPRLASGPGGARPVNIDHPAYAEVGFVDPDGQGHARHTLEGGQAMALSPRVWRVTGGDAQAPGAHSYFVNAGRAWALIDPPEADAAHLAALVAAAPGPVAWVLWTSVSSGGRDALRAAWPDAEHLQAAAPGGIRIGEAVARVLSSAGAAQGAAARWLLFDDILFTGESAWSASELPREAQWIAPARGFLQKAR